jgi:phage baseplate assembly protein W
MSGIDRHTGKLVDGYTSALQSVEVIFSTRIGERVMRRHFGAGLAELLGRATTPALFAAWKTLIAVGIDLWEPRLRVRAVLVSATPGELRLGRAGIQVQVDWRPRALAGDFSVASTRSFTIRMGERVTIT